MASQLARQLGVSNSQELAIFYDLLAELKGWNIESVAEIAEVSASTIYFWLEDKHVGRLANVIKVGRAIGLELQWVKSGQNNKPKLRAVK